MKSKFLVTFQNGDKVWNEIIEFLGAGNPQVFEIQKLCAEKGVIIFMRRLSENSPEADYLIDYYSKGMQQLKESFEAENKEWGTMEERMEVINSEAEYLAAHSNDDTNNTEENTNDN